MNWVDDSIIYRRPYPAKKDKSITYYPIMSNRKTFVAKEKVTESGTGTPTRKGSFRQNFFLTLASIAMFLTIKNFLGTQVFDKIAAYQTEYLADNPGITRDSLMVARFGLDYIIPRHFMQSIKSSKPVLLLPPKPYTQKFALVGPMYSLQNPVYLFYMNPGLKTVTLDNPAQANCTVLFDSQGGCYPFLIANEKDLAFAKHHFETNTPYTPN